MNAQLVERGDLDALTDRIDALCHDDDWALVVDLRDRCRAALDRGKQLWPTAAYAEYRMALDAPAPFAASVLDSAAERFALGPFAEVMASSHSFAELEPHLSRGPSCRAVAHERVARGEDLRAYDWLPGEQDPFGMPFALASWEPDYTVPVYEPSRLRADAPTMPHFTPIAATDTAHAKRRRLSSEAATERSLRDLVATWVAHSNGRSEVVTVEGAAGDAILTLGSRRHRLAALTVEEAIDWMAWAAASGGAHGRRRGMAAGRHGALWAVFNLTGMAEPDLVVDDDVLDEVGDVLSEFAFYLWDDGAPATGWSLRLAVEDRVEGIAWALNATDAKLE